MSSAPSTKRSDRMVNLLEILKRDGEKSLTDLANELGSSAATIRRDVAHLAERGLLERTHGGAKRVPCPSLPVRLRDGHHPQAKQAIANAVASLIPAGQHAIALTGGSTTAATLRGLRHRDDLTLITNSLSLGLAAAELGQERVLIAGGVLRPKSLELVGKLAESTMKLVHVDTAIIGADGCCPQEGLTTHDEIESRTNRLMIDRAETVIAVIDSSKLGTSAASHLAPLSDIDVLVTDDGADPLIVQAIRNLGVDVRVAS